MDKVPEVVKTVSDVGNVVPAVVKKTTSPLPLVIGGAIFLMLVLGGGFLFYAYKYTDILTDSKKVSEETKSTVTPTPEQNKKSYIAYEYNENVWIVDQETLIKTQVTSDSKSGIFNTVVGWQSPTELMYYRHVQKQNGSEGTMYKYDTASSTKTEINLTGVNKEFSTCMPSPTDQNKLACFSNNNNSGLMHLLLIDNGVSKELDKYQVVARGIGLTDEYSIKWSPDGNTVIFICTYLSENDESVPPILVYSKDGTKQGMVLGRNPVFTADSAFSYIAMEENDEQVYSSKTNALTTRTLLGMSENKSKFHMRYSIPSSKYIYWYEDGKGNSTVRLAGLDGKANTIANNYIDATLLSESKFVACKSRPITEADGYEMTITNTYKKALVIYDFVSKSETLIQEYQDNGSCGIPNN